MVRWAPFQRVLGRVEVFQEDGRKAFEMGIRFAR